MGCRGITGWLGVKGWEKDNVGDAFNGKRWAGRAERLRFFHCARLLTCKHSSARSGMRSIFTPTTNLSVVSVVSDQTKICQVAKGNFHAKSRTIVRQRDLRFVECGDGGYYRQAQPRTG